MKPTGFAFLISTALGGGQLDAGEIRLSVEGFGSDDGQARIVVMRGRAEYEGQQAVGRVLQVPIANGTAVWQGTLPDGKYVVIAHHDSDGNNHLDRPVLGVPREPYGYSNGYWTSFGLPDFERVAFDIGDGTIHQSIYLRRNWFAVIGEVGLAALTCLLGLVAAVRLWPGARDRFRKFGKERS